MARGLSSAALASIHEQETDEVWLILVTIDHADLANPIRVVSNMEDITSNGETFVGLPFEIILPDENPDEPGEVMLRVDNVDKTIVETVRIIQSPPTVKVQVVLASQPDSIEAEIDGLTMRDVTWDVGVVEGRLRLDDLVVEPLSETITPARFPGLFLWWAGLLAPAAWAQIHATLGGLI